ncbi:hypothetical protein M9H77_31777 [Catharanthus roseus]|uniref:Uncharacterized protein n=1 Tax=Catharanthus roseus TaxID=4058 RepID=A0ACC0A2V8_CATRO|nr:hypothetical protein M9H77_31777 [Catharanthus roseus]
MVDRVYGYEGTFFFSVSFYLFKLFDNYFVSFLTETWKFRWRLCVRDGPALAVEVLSYLNDEYIRWYRRITQVYIRNPTNRDTRSEVDDMTSLVIHEPPSSPSHMAVFTKKVQTIIRSMNNNEEMGSL